MTQFDVIRIYSHTVQELVPSPWEDSLPRTPSSLRAIYLRPSEVRTLSTKHTSGLYLAWHMIRIQHRAQPLTCDVHEQKGYGPAGTLEGADTGAVRKWGTGGPGYNIKAEFNPRKHEFGMKHPKSIQTSDSAWLSTYTYWQCMTQYIYICHAFGLKICCTGI